MLRKCLFSLIVVALAGLPAPAADELTLDGLLAKHYQALGGADARKAVSSAKFTGKMSMGPSMQAPFTLMFKRPLKTRMEFTVEGMTGIQAFDGEKAWMVMPFIGVTEAAPLDEDQAEHIREQADFDGPLVDWRKKGHDVKLVGRSDVDGKAAYELEVKLSNGEVRHSYLDAESFLMVKQVGKTEVQGAEAEIETKLSDYRAVGGLMFPHKVENMQKGAPMGQAITIESIELGAELPDDLFAMPQKKAAEGDAPAE
jgi:outer membrane lipoprotein-sorting protein